MERIQNIYEYTEKDELVLKKQLLELIDRKKNNKEICETLNISTGQLYSLLLDLKNNGIMLSRKYYSDGSLKYKPIYTFFDLKKASLFETDKTIITDSKENEIKLLAISDLHFGNELERIDLINRAFNYCTKKNINIILCGGDLIDGTFSRSNQKISNLQEQIEYFIKNYPYDKNILTFSVAGDHDISAFTHESLCLIEKCNNYRHDIIIGGYNNAVINIKNDQILLHHHIDAGNTRISTAPIILHGHIHRYKTYIKDNALNVILPSLSNINQPMPTALELKISFNKGFFDVVGIKQIYFGEKDIVISESFFDLLKNRTVVFDDIKNIESFKHVLDENEETQLVKSL